MSSLQTCLSALALAFVAGTAMAEGPSPLAEDKLRHNEYVEPTRAEKLEACILLWEEANHITKRRWREICRVQEHAR